MAAKSKIHNYSLTLKITSVDINIRFPCRLTTSFRFGKHEVDSAEEIKLADARQGFSQELNATCNFQYNLSTGDYQQQKATIALYIISTSGKNIAGVCSLDVRRLLNKGTNSLALSSTLQRCPDKAARISYTLSTRFLNEVDPQSSDRGSLTGAFPEDDPSPLPHSSSIKNRIALFDTVKSERKVTTANKFSSTNKVQVERDHSTHSQALQQPENRFARSRFSGIILKKGSMEDINTPPSQYNGNKREAQESSEKVTRLEVERNSYIKEISQLKSQLETAKYRGLLKNTLESELQTDNQRLKKKLEAAEAALDTTKKAKLDLQRQVSQIGFSLRAEKLAAEELRARQERFEECEVELRATKKAKDDAQRLAKQKNRQLRQALDKVDDLQTSFNTLQKRCEMKENFYKQEMKKFNEKLIEAEQDRQSLLSENASLKEAVQERQRKLVLASKDREKSTQDERTRLTKKVEQLKKDVQKLEELRIQDKATIDQQISTLDTLRKTVSTFEYERIAKDEELQRIKSQLSLEQGYRAKYQDLLRDRQSLSQHKQLAERDYKDRIQQKEDSLAGLQRQLTEKENALKGSAQKVTQGQKKIRERQTRISELEQQLDSTRKKCELLKKAQQRKTADLQDQKNMERALVAQLKSANQSIQQLQNRLIQDRYKADSEVDTLRKSVKRLTEELQLSKSNLTNAQQQATALQRELEQAVKRENAANDKSYKLDERIRKQKLESDSKESQIKRLQEQLTTTQQLLNQAKTQLASTKLGKQDSDIRLTKVQNELNQLKKTLNNTESASSDTVNRLTRSLRDKDAEIARLHEDTTRMEIEKSQLETHLATSREQVRVRAAELVRERQSNQALKKEVLQLKDQIRNLQAEAVKKQDEISEATRNRMGLQADKARLEQLVSVLKSDSEKFKGNTYSSTEALAKLIQMQYTQLSRSAASQEPVPSQQPPIFEPLVNSDSQLSSYHASILRVWRNLSDTYQEYVSVSNSRTQHLQQEQARLKKQLEHETKELAASLALKQEELSYFMETHKYEKEGYEDSLNTYNAQIESLVRQLNVAALEKKQMEELIKKRGQQIDQLNSKLQAAAKEIEDKTSCLSAMARDTEIAGQEQQRARNKLLAEQQEIIKQAEKREADLNVRITDLNTELGAKALQYEELTAAHKNTKKELEGRNLKIVQITTQIQILNTQVQDLNLDLQAAAKRDKEYSAKLTKSQESLIELEAQISRELTTHNLTKTQLKDSEDMRKQGEKDRQLLLKKIQNLESETQSKQQATSSLNQELEAVIQELEATKAQLRQETSAKQLAKDEITIKNRQITQLNKQLDVLKERLQKQEKEITAKLEEIATLRETYETEKTGIQSVTAQVQASRQALEISLKKEQQAKERLMQEVETLKEAIKLCREQYEVEIADLNEQVYQHSSEVNTLRIKEEEDLEASRQLQAENAGLQAMLRSARQQLEEKQAYIRVDVTNKEKEYYEITKKSEQKILQLQQTIADCEEAQARMVAVHEEQRAQLEDQLNKCKLQIETALIQKTILQEEAHNEQLDYQNKISQLKADLEEERREHKNTARANSEKLADAMQKAAELSRQKSTQEQSLQDSLNLKTEELRKLGSQLQSVNSLLTTAEDTLKKQRQAHLASSKQYQDKLNQLKRQLSLQQVSQSSQQEEQQRAFAQTLADLEAKLKQQETEFTIKLNQTKSRTREDEQRHAKEIHSYIVRLENQKLHYEKILDDINTKAHSSGQEVDDLRHAVGQLELKIAVQDRQLKNSTSNTQKQQAANKALQQQIASLQKEVAKAQSAQKSAQDKLETLEQHYNKAAAELQEARQSIQHLSASREIYNPSQVYISQIQQSVKAYQLERTHLLAKISQVQNSATKASARIQLLFNEVDLVTQEKTKIVDKLRELSLSFLKSKSKALSKTKTQQESKIVIDEYKIFQDKLNEILDFSAVMLHVDRIPKVEENVVNTFTESHNQAVAKRERASTINNQNIVKQSNTPTGASAFRRNL